MYTEITKCRICKSSELTHIMSLGVQYLTGVFPKKREQKVTNGPVDLVKCTAPNKCGLVQLRQSFDIEEMYGMNYGYRSGLNPSMVAHLKAKVEKIVTSNILEPKDLIIDIGSNDATTLKFYPSNKYQLLGVDPTGVKFSDYYPKHIKLAADLFSSSAVKNAVGQKKAKVITSFSMFYDLEDPVSFAQEVCQTLDDQGIWVFEQSYLPTMLRTNSFDTICQEHLEFYALKQIMWIAEAAELKILDVEFNNVNGGSFSVTAAKKNSNHSPNVDLISNILRSEDEMGLNGIKPFQEFQRNVTAAKFEFIQFLAQAKQQNKTVYALGASTKGNVLLQYFDMSPSLITAVGEVNEDKIGSFTPGTQIPIVSEREVLDAHPDYLVVLPWHFKDFFTSSPVFKGRNLVFPLPNLQIIVP